MYFYLSLGSNIEPEKSAAEMLLKLCQRFEHLALVPFCYTKPEAIESEQDFANALVVICAQMSSAQVKAALVEIETQMGRDRAHPRRSFLSRSADIDILAESAQLDLNLFKQAEEIYVQSCLSLSGPFVDLSFYGLTPHQRAASVHLDAAAGQVVIVEDELQGFEDWAEATFACN